MPLQWTIAVSWARLWSAAKRRRIQRSWRRHGVARLLTDWLAHRRRAEAACEALLAVAAHTVARAHALKRQRHASRGALRAYHVAARAAVMAAAKVAEDQAATRLAFARVSDGAAEDLGVGYPRWARDGRLWLLPAYSKKKKKKKKGEGGGGGGKEGRKEGRKEVYATRRWAYVLRKSFGLRSLPFRAPNLNTPIPSLPFLLLPCPPFPMIADGRLC